MAVSWYDFEHLDHKDLFDQSDFSFLHVNLLSVSCKKEENSDYDYPKTERGSFSRYFI